MKKGKLYKIQIDLKDDLAESCKEWIAIEYGQNHNWEFLGILKKIVMKKCQITGNFGDIEILTEGAVAAGFETLVQTQTSAENKITALEYTAFMVNKEKQSKFSFENFQSKRMNCYFK